MEDLEKVLNIIENFADAQEQEFVVGDDSLENHRAERKFLNNKIKEWHEKAQAFDNVIEGSQIKIKRLEKRANQTDNINIQDTCYEGIERAEHVIHTLRMAYGAMK